MYTLRRNIQITANNPKYSIDMSKIIVPLVIFVLFLLAIVLYDLLLFTASDCTSGIFKLFLSFWFWPLHCLSFDLRLLNSKLESSNVSYWTTSTDIQCNRHKLFSNILIVKRTTYYITSPVLLSKDKRWFVLHSTSRWLFLISVLLKY
jgi:hypothetical protein